MNQQSLENNMNNNKGFSIYRVDKKGKTLVERQIVQEYPLKLKVNGRELVTLIASSHHLNYLVAGFLRMQGLIESLKDIEMLGICSEHGVVEVRIRGDVPQDLKPTLTSGCGAGINFELPDKSHQATSNNFTRCTPETLFSLMKDLFRQADSYFTHGGIHSAGVGEGGRLLLHTEDIGRHNTFDRIAGEALFKGMDLKGKILVTSGRVPSEMVSKAARLGIEVIASRTSPTDMAIRMSEAVGITLVGYVRGESFEIYSHPERIEVPGDEDRIPGVTGVILAGGESRRMGCNKALLPLHGARFIELIYERMAALFDEVLLVTNSPTLYEDIPCRKVPDLYPNKGPLAGIHSGLSHARCEQIFVAACDMPFISTEAVRHICRSGKRGEVIIPRSEKGLEPLHALYHKSCIPALKDLLSSGSCKITCLFPKVSIHEISVHELAPYDPDGRTFCNINTPQEYFDSRTGAFALPVQTDKFFATSNFRRSK